MDSGALDRALGVRYMAAAVFRQQIRRPPQARGNWCSIECDCVCDRRPPLLSENAPQVHKRHVLVLQWPRYERRPSPPLRGG